MRKEFFFGLLKIKNIPKEQMHELSSKILETHVKMAPLHPEDTLKQVYSKLKKQPGGSKTEEKSLKDAREMIRTMAELIYKEVTGIVSEDHERELMQKPGVKPANKQIPGFIRAGQAIKKLIAGNKRFLLEKEKYGLHHEPLEAPYKYDTAILTCSDARNEFLLFRDFVNQRVLVFQLAGNVYPSKKPERAGIDRILSMLMDGGSLIVIGHKFCGPVNAKKHAEIYGKNMPDFGKLLRSVELHDDGIIGCHESNVVSQCKRLNECSLIKRKNIKVSPCIFDFTNATDSCIKYLGEGKEPEVITSFRSSAVSRIKSAGMQKKDLGKQAVHTVIICDPIDLGRFTDPRIIFDAGLNDIFVVSANANKLDSVGIASLEYALSFVDFIKDNGNIVILHSNKKTCEMIAKQLRENEIIRAKTDNGKIITIILYNSVTGKIKL